MQYKWKKEQGSWFLYRIGRLKSRRIAQLLNKQTLEPCSTARCGGYMGKSASTGLYCCSWCLPYSNDVIQGVYGDGKKEKISNITSVYIIERKKTTKIIKLEMPKGYL